MEIKFKIPDNLFNEMKKYKDMNWDNIVTQALEGCIHDFGILDKLKEFWGVERLKIKKK